MNFSLLCHVAALVLALMSTLWVVSIFRRDVSIVDPWWSICFLVVTADATFSTGVTPPKVCVLVAVAVWALRLWLHLLLRSRGRAEDPRYAAFRKRFGPERYWWLSFFQVFLLQGALALFVSSPLLVAASESQTITVSLIVGLVLFAIGFAWETISDGQLQRFRDDPSRHGGVLDTGLWRYSRHPNYFGETLMAWGMWLFAVQQPYGWATVAAPLLMTFLLLKVSGVAMLDAHLASTKPGYAEYIRRTSAFIPRRPLA